MAQVPLTGNIEMFDSANSIYEVLVAEFGTPASKDFSAILDYVKTNLTIASFHPGHRPASLNDVNQTSHFRGFPYALPTYGTWYARTVGYVTHLPC